MVSPAQSQLIQAMLTPAQVGAEISSTLAAKSLDSQKQAGAAILKLLDSAATTVPAGDVGNTLDITA